MKLSIKTGWFKGEYMTLIEPDDELRNLLITITNYIDLKGKELAG